MNNIKSNMSSTMQKNQIVKTEIVNRAKLEFIVQNWDGLEIRATMQQDSETWDSFKVCRDYLERLDSKGTKKTFYKQCNDQGRFYAVKHLSLQGLPREVRHTISKDYYYDIDFVNCHPQLLAQYCNKYSIPCVSLNNYVNNRDELFSIVLSDNDGMTRDDIKQVVLSIMNGGKKAYNDLKVKPDWIKSFYYEMRAILEAVCDLNKEAFEIQKKRRKDNEMDYNYEGSYVNTLLCDLENKAIQCLDAFLTKKGFQVDVLVFDGLMVRRDLGKIITPEILLEASDHINSKIGYSLNIVEKPMDEGLEIDCVSDYDKWKAEFELTNCKIHNLTQYLEMDVKEKKLIFRETNKLLDAHANNDYVKDWIKDKNIKTYRTVNFLPPPLVRPPDVFNTFSGFAIEKVEAEYNEECINPILTHISYLMNHDKPSIDYFLNWLANIFQAPGAPTNTAIIIRSEEGVGKNVLFDFIKSILGEEYCLGTSNPGDDCFGKFNAFLMNKLLVNMNETKQQDTAEYIELIKTYITEKTIQINAKNRQPVSINNFMRWIFFTNRQLPFKLGKAQRRFWGTEADSSMANKPQYFKTLLKACNDTQVQYTFYKYLMNRDISQFDFINSRPNTPFMESMISAGSDKIPEFLDHIRDKFNDQIDSDNCLTMQSSALHRQYCDFLLEMCEMEKITFTAFGLSLKNYKMISKHRTKHGIMITINYNIE